MSADKQERNPTGDILILHFATKFHGDSTVKEKRTIASEWKLASHVRGRLEILNYSLAYT